MKQVTATVVTKGEPIQGLDRPHGRRFSQTISLRCLEIASEAKPGQFVMVRCGDECVLPRPFSIHQADSQDVSLYFAVLEDGKGTHWLSQRNIGDSVEIFGPLGNGFSIRPDARRLLLVAGGMGIAPLYFLAQDARKKGLSVTLLYGTAVKNPYPETPHEIELVRATEDGSVGYHGLITDLIPKYIDRADQVFACGPMPMYRDLYARREKLLKNKPTQVSLELVMGCGRGVCYSCTVKTRHGLKHACQDGPVFDLDDIIWEEMGL